MGLLRSLRRFRHLQLIGAQHSSLPGCDCYYAPECIGTQAYSFRSDVLMKRRVLSEGQSIAGN
jgi:hypothetical protein